MNLIQLDLYDDTHTASWNWGDSTTSAGTVTESGGSGSIQNTHMYSIPRVYTITLTVNNSDGATVTTQYNFVVAYDPNGGFVTAGGSVDSTAGTYINNPTFTGKGHFGFNVKYQTGSTIPAGKLDFNLKDGNKMKSDKDDEKDPFKFKLKATSFN